MSNYDDWKDPDEIDLTGAGDNGNATQEAHAGGNTSQNNNQEFKEDKPIHLNKKKSGLIVAILFMVIIIAILFFRGCSVSKEVNSPQGDQTQEVVEEESNQNESITIETESESDENSAKSSESNTSSSQEFNTGSQINSSNQNQVPESQSQQDSDSESQNTSNNKTSSSPEGISITEVSDPVLSDVIESSGMVSSKNIYLSNGGSYVYSINLLVLQGDDSYATVEYFCPKTSYDAVTTGDTLIVSYQSDSNGNISINSVAR